MIATRTLMLAVPLSVVASGCIPLNTLLVKEEKSEWTVPTPRIQQLRVEQVNGRYVYCQDCPTATLKTPYQLGSHPYSRTTQRKGLVEVESVTPAIETDSLIVKAEPVVKVEKVIVPKEEIIASVKREPVELKMAEKMEHSIPFAMGRQILGKAGKEVLSSLAEEAKKASKINLYGSTDHTGTNEINEKLSFARAFAVRHELITKHSIDRSKITIKKGNIGMKEKPMHESGDDHRLRRVLVVLVESSGEGSREAYFSKR